MNVSPSPEVTSLDLRGLKCPTPVVTTSKTVSQLQGRAAVLRILADDEGFPADLESWCRATKSELVSLERTEDGAFAATIRVNDKNGQKSPSGATPAVAKASPSGGHAVSQEPVLPAAATLRDPGPASRRRRFDFRGKRCPEPIILLAKEARQLAGVEEFEVLADDDSFPMDIKSWCRSSGATLLSIDEQSGAYRALIQARPSGERARRSGQHQVVRPPDSPFGPRGTALGTPGAPAGPALRAASGSESAEILMEMEDEDDHTEINDSPVTSQLGPVPRGSWGGAGAAPGQAAAAARISGPVAVAAPRLVPAPAPTSDQCIRVDLSAMPPAALQQYLDSLAHLDMVGAEIEVLARHGTFAQDVAMWCARQQHTLVRLNTDRDPMLARIAIQAKGPSYQEEDGLTVNSGVSTALVPLHHEVNEIIQTQRQCTMLVLHNDLEAVLAALMTANAAASNGMQVVLFFAFWGINLLRADKPRKDVPKEKVSFMQRMFKRMMPKGPKRQRLGKLSFGGMGGTIMRGIMRKKNIMQAEELMEQAIEMGVRFTACTTSMSVMGVTRRDLMDLPNLEFAGVASFVGEAKGAGVSLVF